MVRRVLSVFALMVIAPALRAQAPASQARDGAIAGRVVDAVSGKPVSGVVVALGGANIGRVGPSSPELHPGPPRILTAADGRFVFRDLPSGSFSISATRDGYADGAYGRRRPGGGTQDVVLSDTQRSTDVVVRVWKLGVIAGTLTDESGQPVIGALLRVLARTPGGARRFAPSGQAVVTDDRGAYRFSGLMPGDYLVVVSAPRSATSLSVFEAVARTGRGGGGMPTVLPGMPGAIAVGDAFYILAPGTVVPPPPKDGRFFVYPQTFYPSALTPAEAAVVTLASGDERSAVDIQLQPIPVARVSGILTGPDGPFPTATLRLRPSGFDEAPLDQDALTSLTDINGRFIFPAVPQGQYLLSANELGASSRTPGANILWTDTPIVVTGDVDNVVATLHPGLRITARIEFQGSTDPPKGTDFMRFPFLVEAADAATSPRNRISISGTSETRGFTFAGFAAGRYFVQAQPSPQGWMFKSAMLNGVDVSETPFEFTRDVTDLVITFTDKWSGMGGLVHAADGNPDATAAVVVFPTNADAWTNYGSTSRRLRSGRTNTKGEFGISSLPPGDYYAVAIPDEQSADWRDPKMLEALARIATQVTIGEGEHRTIELRTREVPQ